MKSMAKYNNANSSVQKLRLVADLIRGKDILKSLEILNYVKKKTSILLKKVLESAIANFIYLNENKTNLNKLIIFKIIVNPGSTRKKISPRAKGRSNIILKRSSHITIIISNR